MISTLELLHIVLALSLVFIVIILAYVAHQVVLTLQVTRSVLEDVEDTTHDIRQAKDSMKSVTGSVLELAGSYLKGRNGNNVSPKKR